MLLPPGRAAAGAAGIVCERLPSGLPADLPVVQVTHSRRALAQLAIRLYGAPARAMTMIGITGTKGKTTTAHLIAAVLTAAGRRVGILGTNGVSWPGHREALDHTTPESSDLQRLLRRMVNAGCDTCVMEVSSLGLKMDRVTGIVYDIGVFTNLSPDHIGPGEHASFAEYRAWKSVLFRRCRVGVVNADAPQLPAILNQHNCRVVTYGIDHPAHWRAKERSNCCVGRIFWGWRSPPPGRSSPQPVTSWPCRGGSAFTMPWLPWRWPAYCTCPPLQSMGDWPGLRWPVGWNRCRWARPTR